MKVRNEIEILKRIIRQNQINLDILLNRLEILEEQIEKGKEGKEEI